MEKIIEQRMYNEKYELGIDLIECFKSSIERTSKINPLDSYGLNMLMEETKSKPKTELATDIMIDFSLNFIDYETIGVKLKIGTTRMYILNDLNLFYNGYLNNNEIYLGKQLCFIPKRENFSEESKWLFDLIIEYCEMLNYYDEFERHISSDFSKKEIILKNDRIDKFFDKLMNQTVNYIEEYSKKIESVMVVDEKLNVSCSIQKEKVSI